MERDTVIEFRNVTKEYRLFKTDRQRFRAIFSKHVKCKKVCAIDDVSFSIKRGEAVALFGRNGAGKSTLLKMITGVTYPTTGDIKINGRVSALLELTAGFDPELTGRQNIYFRGQLMGLPESEVKKLEPKIVEFADIGDYMDQPVRTYSSGMKARLGFAINVNVDPEILIVDEALSVGDFSFRRKCTEKVNELITGKNITFLLVTHSVGTAKEFCNRGIVMKRGKMIFDSNIEEAAAYYSDMVNEEDAEKRKIRTQARRKKMELMMERDPDKAKVFLKLKNREVTIQAEDYRDKEFDVIGACGGKVCLGTKASNSVSMKGGRVKIDEGGLAGFNPRTVRPGEYTIWFVGEYQGKISAAKPMRLHVLGENAGETDPKAEEFIDVDADV